MGTLRKIIILHGWTYSLEKWKYFADLLRQNGFEFSILRIPGLTTNNTLVWDVRKYSDWLKQSLLGEKGKVILLGHSNGGRIAAFFASKYPEKIHKLILIDTAGIFHNELSLRLKRYLFHILTKIGKKFVNFEIMRRLLYWMVGEKDYQVARPNMKKTMFNLINTDMVPIFKKLKIFTLIIWGGEDKITPISDARIINKLIKNSKLRVIEGAKHSPFFSHPQKVVDIIKNDL